MMMFPVSSTYHHTPPVFCFSFMFFLCFEGIRYVPRKKELPVVPRTVHQKLSLYVALSLKKIH